MRMAYNTEYDKSIDKGSIAFKSGENNDHVDLFPHLLVVQKLKQHF